MIPTERKLSVRQLIIALLRDQDIHEGCWGLSVQFEALGGTVLSPGKSGEKLPGVAVAVSGVTLVPVAVPEDGALDAALVNPLHTKHVQSSVNTKNTIQ